MSDQSAHPLYSKPLEENQIRILVLQQGKGKDPLHCQIRLVDALNEASDNAISYVRGSHDTTEVVRLVDTHALKETSYDAISYVWGSQDTTEMIRCTKDIDGERVDLPLT